MSKLAAYDKFLTINSNRQTAVLDQSEGQPQWSRIQWKVLVYAIRYKRNNL